jgi:hypothetical protein
MIKEKINCDLRTYPEDVQNEFSIKNRFIPNENIFNSLRVITSLCPKLILSGRLSLFALSLTDIDFEKRKPDLDFSLTEPLTEYEFDQIVALLELEYTQGTYEDDEVQRVWDELNNSNKKPTSEILKQDLIRLYDKKNDIYIDIFNSYYQNDFSPKHENLYPVNFGVYEKNKNTNGPTPPDKLIPHIVYCQHPSVTISHKVKYSFYTNYGKMKKHYDDVVDLFIKQYSYIHEQLEYYNNKKKDFIKIIEISQEKDLITLSNKVQYHVFEVNRRK